jgi:chaperone required for assembly of F1-ATPase
MKRFYKTVTAVDGDGGYRIHLDGKPVKTPSRQELVAPSREIAALLVSEWEAQAETIKPDTMPVTQIVTTVREHGEALRPAITEEILGYLNTDLLCYRAAEPEAVGNRQILQWDPWLSWFEKRFSVPLQTTLGLTALRQPDAAHRAVREAVEELDLWRFTVVQIVTGISGSIILALAFAEKAASVEDVFHAIHVEEDYRAEIYNETLHGMAPHQEREMASKMWDLKALRAVLDTL